MLRSSFKLLPSPAMAVALLALFVALGGVGYAAVKIGSKQIKDNSILSKDIKNGTIRGRDVGRNTLGGAAIQESSLGQVPNAAHASRADAATTAGSAATAGRATSAAAVDDLHTVGSYKKVASSATNNDPELARAAATEVPLFSVGVISVYGKCYSDTDGDVVIGTEYIKTSENGAIFDSDTDALTGSPAFLNTGSLETDRQLNQTTAGANLSTFAGDGQEFAANAPDGTGLNGTTSVAVKNGTLPGGNGVYGAGDVCIFSGQAIG